MASIAIAGAATGRAAEQWLFIASPGEKSAIYSCRLDTATGKFGELQVAAAGVRTGFMALHPDKSILYAASSEEGRPNGGVRAYKVIRGTGKLELLGKASTEDQGTTHIEVHPRGKSVAVCHYSGEGTTVLQLLDDGALGKRASRVIHEGFSVDPKRQTRPHPHGVAYHQGGKFLCVADLGTDQVDVLRVNRTDAEKVGQWKAAPGSGPRHVAFHPNGRWLYCINEMKSTMSVLRFNDESGELTEIETKSTLPADFKANSSTAEDVVHPNGRFLYGSNRGHNSTAVFAIDRKSGRLTLVEHEPTQGDHPRFVGLDSTGSVYIAANMRSNNLVSYLIDQETGALTPSGQTMDVARPMCVLFVK